MRLAILPIVSVTVSLGLLSAGSSSVAPAKVGSIRFDELVRHSDAIVLGKIVRSEMIQRTDRDREWLDGSSSEHVMRNPSARLAEVEVIRTVKGDGETKT